MSSWESQCLKIVNSLSSNKISEEFLVSVEEKYPEIKNEYRSKVSKPMDLSTIKKKLEKKEYTNIDSFIADMNLIWNNCIAFNGKTISVSICAMILKEEFEKHIKTLKSNAQEAWLYSSICEAKKIFNTASCLVASLSQK